MLCENIVGTSILVLGVLKAPFRTWQISLTLKVEQELEAKRKGEECSDNRNNRCSYFVIRKNEAPLKKEFSSHWSIKN